MSQYSRYPVLGSGGGGGVASVSGSSPIVSSGGANPIISILNASNAHSGALTAADHITFAATSAANTTDVTLAVVGGAPNANGSSLAGQVLTLQPVDAANPGVLLSADYSTFVATSAANTADVTLGAFGAVPNAVGASLTGQVLTLQPADATHPGLLSTGAQAIGGAKTFASTIAASNLSGTNTGDQTITLTGDVTGSGTGSFAATIAASAVTNAKLADMGSHTLKGNKTGVPAAPSDLSVSDVNTMLGTVTTATGNVAGGYPVLDGGGKVAAAQLPSTLMNYQGAWNAATNTPMLADGTGTNGDVWRASVAGTQNLGSGAQTWGVGDFAIYNGAIWQHSPAADGVTSVNGATGAVTVNAINQLTGDVTAGPAVMSASAASSVAKIQGTAVSGTTGSNNVVFSNSPTLVTPVIGAATGVSLSVVGQLTSTIAIGTAPLVVTSTTRVANLNVATAGAADTVTTNANLTGPITSVGNATSIASQTGTGSTFVVDNSPTLITPIIGAATGTSLSVSGQLTSTIAAGTAPLVITSTTRVANLNVARAANADTVTTNANLTGPITSVGNATAIASQTGTGSKFVVDTSPTLVTPVLGVASGTTITLTDQLGVGSLDANSLLFVGGGVNPLSGTTETGINAQFTATASANSTIRGIRSAITNGAGITTVNIYNFDSVPPTPGAASVITRFNDFVAFGSLGHIATNNAAFTDNNTYTGNWFLNQSGTDASTLGGALTVTGLTVNGSTTLSGFTTLAVPNYASFDLSNLGISAVMAASALTLALKVNDGATDASAGAPIVILMRSTSLTSGSYNKRLVTAALSQVISSGTTLGFIALAQTSLYIYAIDSDGAGTIKIGASTARIDDSTLQSTVSESAAVTATNATPCVFTENGHGRNNGDTLTLTGTPPVGFSLATIYYIVAKTANTYQLALTPVAIGIGSTSTGTSVVVHTASNRIATAGVYTTVPIRLIGSISIAITTPGTWSGTPEVDLPTLTSPKPITPTIQRFTTGTGTYSTPSGVLYLKVRMVGGGGGGSGSGTAAGTAAGAGGNTTFGSSVLTANGGGAGVWGANANAGGSTTVGGNAIGSGMTGGTGQGGGDSTAVGTSNIPGGNGAAGPFGGAGGGGWGGAAGTAAVANTGSGGGGGGANATLNSVSGTGGSAGGYVEAIIPSPFPTYAYAIGSLGTNGTGGTSGLAGGGGGAGFIEVTEYYQ